jgi:hypothetical protein
MRGERERAAARIICIMRRRWLLGGAALVVVAAGAGLAVRHTRSGTQHTPATIASVTAAFSARGIVLESDPSAGVAPGVNAHPLGTLWNQTGTSRQGVVSVIVLPTAAQARVVGARHMAATDRDTCGGTTATDYRQWQSGNLVATFSRCDWTRQPFHEARAPVTATVDAIMRSLAG